MTDHNLAAVNDVVKGGPAAPRDPVDKRSSFYLMFESIVEATARPDGRFSQEIYLEGRQFIDKVLFTGGVTDESILQLLTECTGFRRLVHSIGISVKAQDGDQASAWFAMENWGRTRKCETGTKLRIKVPTDGTEAILVLEEQEWSPDDDVPGKMAIEFDRQGALGTASIIFYLHDGYQVQAVEHESPVDYESDAYRALLAKSLLSEGNNDRLKAAIEKAKRGEDVTIAYIGGSITQGAGAKPINTESYAYRSYMQFKQMFGQVGRDHIHLIKAGVGGTPSELGIVRYDRDVLRDGAVKPDIVIIEFAVNDAGDETNGVCYESLALNALASDNRPAVILLFSVFMNDWNLQDRLSPVGTHYGLPMVSIKDAVVEQFSLRTDEGRIISKRQFFYDIYHPTNAGHRLMADCLAHLFAETDQAHPVSEDIIIDKPPIIGNDFVGTKLLDRNSSLEGLVTIEPGSFTATDADLQMAEMDDHPYGSPQFPNNWMHTGESGGESFRMTIRSRRLLLVYKDSGSSEFGRAEIWVDGLHTRDADPHEINWTHCTAVILYNEPVAREHTVEIMMASGQSDQKFTILGFGYVE
ncbi:lysophospholipase L1-like esterase [Paenibacillus cellulosilyticus]|uniref:Lysophospholipase L1-like esterase n=1 Tax=Paenibacillus cellulosilyticus TaxID=375489 RepID=A0A2V2YR48_9BACL|nr:SGNH/GDSL hydrolase family protein [Paenibacillus cellulosilyticus]PWV99528.1 lysophospholipase L1-like esterase [Paenibacillus cellulosilyticus]QKS44778.1 SGNH/GDSL hydrolase family protein [Paenibacillus cellulosilyticus]